MKRLINKCILTTFISVASILVMSGCEGQNVKENGTTIVCTIFPIYDWVCEVTEGAEDVNVILLSENGADMHSFQPTVKNVIDITDCDMFIYVGGESEEWINDCISQNPNPNRVDINLMEFLEDDVLEESHEGILQGEHEHEDADEHLENGDESGNHDDLDEHEEDANENHEDLGANYEEHSHEHEELENDEHIWLSLRRSAKCIEHIADEIALKSSYADLINANADTYIEGICALDSEYRDYFDNNDRKIFVLDRFPFGYMTSDYDVEYMALFSGCTTDANASFQTVMTMADLLNSTDENTVYITENGNEKLARTIIDQSGESKSVRKLNSIQTVSLAGFKEDSKGYLDYMRENLEVLKED